MPRAETVGTPARLADGELGNRPRRGRLPVARQRRADEWPMDGPLLLVAVAGALFLAFLLVARHSERRLRYRLVSVLAAGTVAVVAERPFLDIEIVRMLVVSRLDGG